MRRIVPALLLALLVPALGAGPAHAGEIPPPPECVYVTAGGGTVIGYQPTVTACRP